MSDSKHNATYGAARAELEPHYAILDGTSTAKYSGPWWADTADRVVSTIAQAAIATVTAGAIPGLLDIDLISVLSVAGLAGAIAFLKALAITRSGTSVS